MGPSKEPNQTGGSQIMFAVKVKQPVFSPVTSCGHLSKRDRKTTQITQKLCFFFLICFLALHNVFFSFLPRREAPTH